MITFGIPKREINRKEELFPNEAVLTVKAWEGKGFNKKFELNQSALELLEIIPGTSEVIFAFDGEDNAYISKVKVANSLLVNKNKGFSNKSFYDYISDLYKLDNTKDNYLALTTPVEVTGTTVYLLTKIKEEIEIIEVNYVPEFTAEEVKHF